MVSEKKMVLIGSTLNPVHIQNYYNLIKEYFDEILIIGPCSVEFCQSKTIDFGVKNPFKLILNIFKLRGILRKFKPSIVHVHQANSFGFITSLANRRKFPQVLTAWGDDVLIFPKKNFFFKFLTKTSLKFSNYVTADAEIMRISIQEFYKNIPVLIANFGINIDFEELNLSDKENIIYSNRMHDSLYNIDQIILSCSAFLKINPDWKLVIGASGHLTEELKKLANSCIPKGQVEFVGFLDSIDNRNYYIKSKIYVSIPDTDGTSISLLEAMAYACIPFVSNLPANKEWVKDGENGFVVDKGELEKKLMKFNDFDAKTAIQINQNLIQTKASKSVNRLLFYSIYDKILKN